MATLVHTLKRLALIIPSLVVVTFLTIAGVSLSCSPSKFSGKTEAIAFGMEPTAVNSLIYIAKAQNYFTANGIEITIKDNYPSGAAAVEGMLKGEVDIATAAELAIVRQAFANQKIGVLGSIDRFTHMKLIGRKDLGIRDIQDLRGKKIGVPLKSAADFMFARFLDLNGIKANQITIVDVQSPKAADSLVNGEVDAVVAWQPNVMTLRDRLGDNAVVWDVQSGQPLYCALVTTNHLLRNPDLTRRFLKALAQAEDYLVRNDKARDIVQQRLGYGDKYITTIWPEHEFSLWLDQSLITAMEDQARWMISNNMTTEKQIPDFLDYVDETALKAIKPGAVSIIR